MLFDDGSFFHSFVSIHGFSRRSCQASYPDCLFNRIGRSDSSSAYAGSTRRTFSKQTTIVSDEHLAEKKISEFQQVIYLGEIKRTLPKQTIRVMNEAQKIIAIGYNADQLRPFSKLTFHKQEHTSQIKYTDDPTYRQLEKRIIALTVQGADLQREFLLKKHEADLPFVIQTKEGAVYIGILNVVQHNELLAEVLEKTCLLLIS